MEPGTRRDLALTAITAVLGLSTPLAYAVEVLVSANLVDLSTGYRTSRLEGSTVFNDQRQRIGTIVDFVIVRDLPPAAIVEVGGFLGLGGHLIAIPYESLNISNDGRKIALAGASKEAVGKLPEFEYKKFLRRVDQVRGMRSRR